MTQSRFDFEEWAKGHGHDVRHYFEGYYDPGTQYAWRGWSARDESFLKLMEGK